MPMSAINEGNIDEIGILIPMSRLVLAYSKRLFDFRLIKSMFSSYCFAPFRPLLGTLAASAEVL